MCVFKLYHRGIRLDRARVFANGSALGELMIVGKPTDGVRSRVLIAQLMHLDESYLEPVLDDVAVTRITRRGLLLEGREIIPARGAKGRGECFVQAWWCEPNSGPITPLVARPASQSQTIGAWRLRML